jgi:hypothetical protein
MTQKIIDTNIFFCLENFEFMTDDFLFIFLICFFYLAALISIKSSFLESSINYTFAVHFLISKLFNICLKSMQQFFSCDDPLPSWVYGPLSPLRCESAVHGDLKFSFEFEHY